MLVAKLFHMGDSPTDVNILKLNNKEQDTYKSFWQINETFTESEILNATLTTWMQILHVGFHYRGIIGISYGHAWANICSSLLLWYTIPPISSIWYKGDQILH